MNFLGQFLLNKGLVSEKALKDALNHQKEVNRPIGALAVEKEYMTQDQVKAILGEQKKHDKCFGQIALEKEYMSEGQLNELLAVQMNNNILLGEVLLRRGHISHNDFVCAINEFRKLQQAMQLYSKNLLCGLDDSEFLMFIMDSVQSTFLRFGETKVKLLSLCSNHLKVKYNYTFATEIKMTGGKTLSYVICISKNILKELMVRYPLKKTSGSEDMSIDIMLLLLKTIKEYVLAKLSQRSFRVQDINMIYHDKKESVAELTEYLLLKLESPYGKFLLGYKVCDSEKPPV
ncbi:MAG: hypothetical protein SVS15_00075 [Thermodesulfobacteriota bacterium]|nr:hypothetical protein [Thermodesulfobacteriota bacterium]